MIRETMYLVGKEVRDAKGDYRQVFVSEWVENDDSLQEHSTY